MLSIKEKYKIDNVIEKLINGKDSQFLDMKLYKHIVPILNKRKVKYQVFKMFEDASSYVLYVDNPNVIIFKIISKVKLAHKEILGSMFGIGLDIESFGDIIASDDAYIVVKRNMSDFVISNLTMIGNSKIELLEVDVSEVSEFTPSYEEININTSSLRIDSVISKITNLKREDVANKIKEKDILVNSEIITNNSYILKDGDIISVRYFGKYIFMGIDNVTKKGKYIVTLKKYI